MNHNLNIANRYKAIGYKTKQTLVLGISDSAKEIHVLHENCEWIQNPCGTQH